MSRILLIVGAVVSIAGALIIARYGFFVVVDLFYVVGVVMLAASTIPARGSDGASRRDIEQSRLSVRAVSLLPLSVWSLWKCLEVMNNTSHV